MEKNRLMGPQHETAIAFLNSIFKDRDPATFWHLISSEARGFIKGVWFSKGILKLDHLMDFNPNYPEIKCQLDNLLLTTAKTWDIDINDYIITNKVIYDDQFHSKVNFIYNPEQPLKSAPTVVKAVFIPLVYELTVRMEGHNPVWKVDYLKLNALFPVPI